MHRARHPHPRRSLLVFAAAAAGLAVTTMVVRAQLSVRPDDPSGVSIREKRVRVIHSTEPDLPGTSMYLQQVDPWLAYQRGRSLYLHEWGAEDGAFSWLPVRPAAASTTSCGMCHNLPFPSAGSGGNIAAVNGVGRNAPHFFGGGLIETLAMQVRQQALAEFDTNHNGYIDYPSEAKGKRLIVEAAPGVMVDFGSLDDEEGDGRPGLNSAIMPVMVNRLGRRILVNDDGQPAKLTDPGIVGYDLAVGVFASSSGDHQFPALRPFAMGVLNNIMGILPDVPVVPARHSHRSLIDAWGSYSNAGAFQSSLFLSADPQGIPGPVRRGTISEGELDLFEWFMANHPAPAHGPQDDQTRRGRTLMASLGCPSCHVSNWVIQPADARTGMPGDRRFFDLAVAYNPATSRLEGHLRQLTREVAAKDGKVLHVPRREGFVVEDVFTDLRHHDLGPRFWEYVYQERNKTLYATKLFKTPALWGVGSTAPYGHDGLSSTLDDVIRRHGGEAEESQRRYVGAPEADRTALLAFLGSLVLYVPEALPTDLDGDGKIDPAYKIGGIEVGPERFQPELMFRVQPRYRGWTSGPDGDRFFSYELLNVKDAYGEGLKALVDSRGDSLPDVLRAAAAAQAPGTGLAPGRPTPQPGAPAPANVPAGGMGSGGMGSGGSPVPH